MALAASDSAQVSRSWEGTRRPRWSRDPVARTPSRRLGGARPGHLPSGDFSELAERNGWSIARYAGDRTPDRTQRLLNHASWDTFAAMGVVGRFAVAGLEEAAVRRRRRCGGRPPSPA